MSPSPPFNCSASPRVIPQDKLNYSYSRWQFCTALSIILMILPFIFSLVFWWGKNIAKFERLRVRRMVLVHVTWLLLILHAQIGPGYIMYGLANWPCWLRSFITMIIVPLIAANITVRLMTFFFLSELSREMTHLQMDEMPVRREGNYCERLTRGGFDIIYALFALLVPTQKRMERSRTVAALAFVASAKGAAIVFLVILSPFLAVSLALTLNDETYLKCTGCSLASSEVIEIIVVAVLFLLFGIFAAFRVRHYPDPWQLRREALHMCMWGIVILIGFCLGTFNDPPPDVTYDHQLVIVSGFIGFAFSQTVYQVVAAHRSERSTQQARRAVRAKRDKKDQQRLKSVVDSQVNSATHTQGTGDRLYLKTVLGNATLAAEFEKFLVAELGVESLMFLRDTEAWKKAYFDVAPSARFARAKRLYNTYISASGNFPVNIPSEMTVVIRSQIMREGIHDCKENVFDAAREEISDLLQVGALLRFQGSPLYKHYLEDGGIKGRELQSTEL